MNEPIGRWYHNSQEHLWHCSCYSDHRTNEMRTKRIEYHTISDNKLDFLSFKRQVTRIHDHAMNLVPHRGTFSSDNSTSL